MCSRHTLRGWLMIWEWGRIAAGHSRDMAKNSVFRTQMLEEDHSHGWMQWVCFQDQRKKTKFNKVSFIKNKMYNHVYFWILPLLLKHEFIWAHLRILSGLEISCKYSSYCFYFKSGKKYFSVTKSAKWNNLHLGFMSWLGSSFNK